MLVYIYYIILYVCGPKIFLNRISEPFTFSNIHGRTSGHIYRLALLLPKELRTRWEDETITSKAVPPVQKLIEFLKLRSTQQQYEDKGHYSAPVAEKKSFPKKSSGYKGSVHVASSQPSQAPTGQPSQAPAPQAKSNSQKAKPSSFTPCRYSCPLCPEAHYAYSCKTFRDKSVSQRMEFIKAQSLCSKCLKPGHTADDCRNDRVCSVCKGEHNTLIHGAPAGGSGPTEFTGTVNAVVSTSAVNHLGRSKLMMTCQAMVTGPTGRSMPVRVLLDSGADLSSVSIQLAKHLHLKTLEPAVSVDTFDSTEEKIYHQAEFTLHSLTRSDWKLHMAALIVKRIIGSQPRKDASAVRAMEVVQGCTLADPDFDKPGRIDVLLGADILPYVQVHDGPESSIITVKTVFGDALMGTYSSEVSPQPLKATIQVASGTSSPLPIPSPEDQLNSTIARFWELEEPSHLPPPFSPEEMRVQNEYSLTHVYYIPSAGKYQVALPRKLNPLQLGESKNTALRRYYSNERALLRKGHWQKFQQVVQEYLDLVHARPVTACIPQVRCSICQCMGFTSLPAAPQN